MNAVAAEKKNETPDRQVLEQIVARGSEGVLLIDARDAGMPVVFVNPAYEALTGYAAEELVGSAWQMLDRDGVPALEELRTALCRFEALDIDLPDLRKDGTLWFSHVRVAPLEDERGEVRYLLVMQREALAPTRERSSVEIGLLRRELGRARQKIDSLNRTDQATGLLRYEHFLDLLNRDLGIARRDRRPVTVMVFKVVELDVYRKTFGAKAAESCLRMIGAQIGGTLRRAGDLCARCDDTIIAASVLGQEPAQVVTLVDKIVANVQGLKLHNPRATSGRYLGVATAVTGGVPAPEDDAEMLIERATRDLARPAITDAGRKTYA